MERRLIVRHQKIIGSALFPPGVFSGAAVFGREDENSKSRRGQLFALLSISGSKSFDAVLSSKIILDCLEEEYFRDLEGSPLAALERAAVSANHRFIDLSLGPADVSGGMEFNLALAVSWGQVLYLSKVGSAAVYLIRGGVIKEITLGDESRISTASGLISEGDVLILGSRRFREHFPPEKLILSLSSVEEAISKLPEKETLSALILKFEIEEDLSPQERIKFAGKKNLWPRLNLSRLGVPSRVSSLLTKLKNLRRPGGLFLRTRPAVSKPRPRKRFKLLLLLITVVFIGSVVFTLKKQNQNRVGIEAEKIMETARINIASSADLVDLNNRRAKGLLDEALEGLRRLDRLGFKTAETEELSKRARELLSKVTKEKTVSPKLLYDFSLQDRKSNLSALAFVPPADNLGGGFLFIADRDSNTLYRVNLNGDPVSIEKVDGGALKQPLYLSASAGFLFGLDKKGVFSLSLKDLSLKEGLIGFQDLGEVKDFKSYLGNLYFLTPASITRSSPEGEKYPKPTPWLKEGRDLSKTNSLAIDGSVYTLDSSGRILKFETGKMNDFALSGFDGSFSPESLIYTDSVSDHLYIVDLPVLRVFVFSKEGVYQRQLVLEGIEKQSNSHPLFAAAEGLKRAFLVEGTKLFQFDLE